MIPYWLLWTFFFLGVLFSQRRAQLQPSLQPQPLGAGIVQEAPPGLSLMMVVGLIVMSLMIGLRYDVGGDWETYAMMFKRAGYWTFEQALFRGDPAYSLLNLAAQEIGADIWLVNIVCGALTVWGIAALARGEPQPWLALLLSIPYLIVVVAMGYTRQATALGLVMVGLAALLETGSIGRLLFWVALGALFHKTAIICLPLVAFTGQRRKIVDIALLASATFGLYAVLLQDQVDSLVRNYVDARYSSSGAAIRIFMSVLPAIIFLAFRRRLGFDEVEGKLWRNFSLVALVAAVALALTPSSTAVDRIALYLLPLQFVVLARIPGTLVRQGFGNFLVALYSGAVLFVWLNYAAHSQYWLPYRWWLGD